MPWVPMKVDQCGIVRLQDVKESTTWEATHALNKGRTWESLHTQICVPKPFSFVAYFLLCVMCSIVSKTLRTMFSLSVGG